MKGILADNNIQGQLAVLRRIWESEEWLEIWESLGLVIQTFEDIGLDRNTPDDVLWFECQNREIVLITANRNAEGADSLEAAISKHGQPENLPVFTLANAQRIQQERSYAERTAVVLLQYFLEIDAVRGTGRLYVP